MSVVTAITLHTAHEYSNLAVELIQQWLENHNFGRLYLVSQHYGGSKYPQITLYGGGYNYFHPEDEFIKFVMTRQWDYPENVVLILNPEEGGCSVWRPHTYEAAFLE